VPREKKQQKRTQSKNGCWRNLVTAHRGTTRRVKVARRKENLIGKNWTRDVVQGTSKRRTFKRKRQLTQKDKNGLRSRRLIHHLRSRRQFNKTLIKTYEKMTGMEIVNQIAGSPVRLQNTRSKHWTLWRGWPPPKRKKKSVRVRRAGYGGAPATPGVIIPIGERERERECEKGKKLWMMATYRWTARDELALKRGRMQRYDKLANSAGYHEGYRVWLYCPNRTKGKSPKLQR
jgi:hypothetical protein